MKKKKEVAEEGSWSLKRNGFPQSSKKWSRARGGPPQLKARRIRAWSRYALRIQYGTLSWSWMGQPYHETPPSGSSRKGMLITLPKP